MRAASIGLAISGSLIALVFPFLLARQATALNQSILVLMMAGIAGAFVYGAGFRPGRKVLRRCISPYVTWPVILASLGALLALR